MIREGGSSLIAVAVVLLLAGLFLRWDLVDWLIDAVGTVFIVAGILAGLLGVFRAVGRNRSHASP